MQIKTVQSNYNPINRDSNILAKNKLSQPLSCVSQQIPIAINNQVSFKGICFMEIVTRYLKNNAFGNSCEKILDSYRDFGMKEYREMSDMHKNVLRSVLPYSNEDINELVFMYKAMKSNLKKAYPDGCTFVSIGRSPSVFAKTLQAEGEDVIFCPMSDMRSETFFRDSSKYWYKYKSYFEKLGLTYDSVFNKEKPTVFVDYTNRGTSLENFRKLFLFSMNNNLFRSLNINTLSLNNDLLNPNGSRKMDRLITKWLWDSAIKQYCPTPLAHVSDIVRNPGKILKHRMSNPSKLLQFHLIDKLQTSVEKAETPTSKFFTAKSIG